MKSNETKSQNSKLAAAFFVLSAIMLAVAIYMLITTIMYVNMYLESYAMSFSDMWSDMVQYVITGAVPYFVYTLLLFGMGAIINRLYKNCGKGSLSSDPSASCEAVKKGAETPAETVPQAETGASEDSPAGETEAMAPEKQNAEICEQQTEISEKQNREEESAEAQQSEDNGSAEITASEDAVEETKIIEDGKPAEEETLSEEHKEEKQDEEK